MRRLIVIGLLLTLGCGGGAPPPPAEPGHEEHHDEHAGEEHAEGEVRLTPEQVEEAGVRVQVARLEALQAGLETTGVVVPDPDLTVQVSSMIGGVVRHLGVSVGDQVGAGQRVAVVDSAELAKAKAEYHHAEVEEELAAKNLAVRRRLAELGDETQRQTEEARAEVAQAQAAVESAWARVEVERQRLERLEELLEDGIASLQQVQQVQADVRAAEADLAQAETALAVARRHLERENRIKDQGLRVSKEIFEAEANLARSREDQRHSRDLLSLLGADPEDQSNLVSITSPIGGTVVERPVTQGERVETGEPLAVIVDTSRVWIWADIYERDLAKVREGMRAIVRVEAYPEREFSAQLTYLDPRLDTESRTVRARLAVRNPEGLLRPAMFARVTIATGSGNQAVVVPSEALASVENQDVVYLSEAPGEYHRQPVRVGSRQGDLVEIVEGVEAGQEVVSAGVSFVKSVDQKEKMGGHSH